MSKKTLSFFVFFVLGGLIAAGFTFAAEKTPLYFFYGSTCPHCQKAEEFFEKVKPDYPDLEIILFEVFGNKENAVLFQKAFKAAGLTGPLAVPVIFIGEKTIIGYADDETTGKEIKEAIKFCQENSCSDPLEKIKEEEKPKIFNLPLIGGFDAKKVSLPLLSIALGLMDGFNPCAMWVLLLLISLLLTVRSKKKLWLVGGTFIAVSGLLYFLFMTAWLNFFLFIGYVSLTRVIIGAIAVAAGVWRIKDFFTWQSGVCKVGDEKSHGKIEQKIRSLLVPAALPATFLGIVALAFSVNLVEFFCSAGFPAIFTQVLAVQNVSSLTRYLYILVYVIFYMLDDIIVFSLAVLTLQKLGFTDKYAKWSALLGGLLMLLLGAALVFKPELLMFG
ncbi:MAG: glutaredoxin [bacterium]|nr:glutaredoxin [bacterium]